MRNIFVIARKELLSTFRQRNILFIMFLSPIVLVAIMALAFSGLGASGGPEFADIRVAVVNLDEGFTLQGQLPTTVTNSSGSNPSLADVEITLGDQTINLGEQLEQNLNLDLSEGDLAGGDFSLNFGNQLAAILLSQPLTATSMVSGVGEGFDVGALTCSLLPADEQGENAFEGSLDELLDAVVVSDPAVARAGVTNGDYAVAVIIPPDFSNSLAPDFGFGASDSITMTGQVEVVANNATPISASIVRSVVEAIVIQFERVTMALSALIQTTLDRVAAAELDSSALAGLDPTLLNVDVLTRTLQSIDASVLEPLGCLIMPGANNVEMRQQPLDIVQTRNPFTFLMVTLGAGQAVFFALFTGVFGINSIYEDRRQGTLQRVLAAPVSSSDVLFGRVLGNLLIVSSQLLILLTAFTVIASLVEGELIFIWGTNILALLLVILGLALFTTGLGVLIVGLANSSEQVQLIGPMITLLIGALGGIFGTIIPPEIARISPTYWGIEALHKLSVGEVDIGLNLLVLFGAGALLIVAGTFFFRRRMGL